MSSTHPMEQNPYWIDQALRANWEDFAAWINKEPPLENADIRKLAN